MLSEWGDGRNVGSAVPAPKTTSAACREQDGVGGRDRLPSSEVRRTEALLSKEPQPCAPDRLHRRSGVLAVQPCPGALFPHCPLGDHHASGQALKGLPGMCVPGVYSQHGPVAAQSTLLIARCA